MTRRVQVRLTSDLDSAVLRKLSKGDVVVATHTKVGPPFCSAAKALSPTLSSTRSLAAAPRASLSFSTPRAHKPSTARKVPRAKATAGHVAAP